MFKPTETQRIHEKMLLTRKVTWERVFCNLGDLSNPEFHKGKPGKSHCSLADLEEFIEHSGKLIQQKTKEAVT